MTFPPTAGQRSAEVLAEQVLGPGAAKRLGTFRDGVPYVRAGRWARFFAWLADFVVIVLGVVVLFIVVAVAGRTAELSDGALGVITIAIVFLVPLLYGGLCYRDGRALGAVLTGTRLVRGENGGRLGGRAPWAMLLRMWAFLTPLLFVAVLVGALAGGGTPPSASAGRVSVDPGAMRQLRAAGIA